MTCGSCEFTDGCCYTSLPPQIRCNITGKFHYYNDECDCEGIKADKVESFKKITELLCKPGALMAVNYDSDKAPAVAITGEEAEIAYKSLLNLPLCGECEGIHDNKISITPYKSTIDLDEIDKRLLEPVCMYSTRCLVCEADVPVYFLGGGPMICADCKKAIKFIKEKFNKELENYEV